MTSQVLRPLAEGFKGSLRLWAGIVVAIVLALVSTVGSFVGRAGNDTSMRHLQ